MSGMQPINVMLCSLVIAASAQFQTTALAQQPATDTHTEHRAEAAPPSLRIQAIRFSGNQRLSDAQLARVIGLKAGDLASSQAIETALSEIVTAYRSLGADLAVSAAISATDRTHCQLQFVIDEHGSGGSLGAPLRSGDRMGGAPPPPPPATRQ